MASLTPSHLIGLGRSLAIYYGQPLKLRRMGQLYGRWVVPGSVCFDIGSHVGNRAFVWQKLGATVVAVEPQPLFARWLRWQFGRSPNVTLLEAAIGADIGMASLQVSARTPTVSSVSAEWINTVQHADSFKQVRWQQSLQVPQLTLDRLIAQHGLPAFCKIDVEGHELAVLNGLSQPLPALSFEVLGAAQSAALDCVRRLDELGRYRYAVSLGEKQRLGAWMNSAEINTWLSNLPPDGPSADIFAELVTFS